MIIRMNRVVLIAASCILAAGLVLLSTGCGGGGLSREELDEIDATFRAGTSRLSETTSFVYVLQTFDFENATFIDDIMSALDASREAADELQASIEGLRDFNYEGTLSMLGGYLEEYIASVTEAIEELSTIRSGIEQISLAIEPIMSEEAVITQLEEPGDDAELLDRLRRLSEALESSLAELSGLEVPAKLTEYKSLLEGIFTSLQNVIRDLIYVASAQTAGETMENNPDFLRMQDLMETYVPVVKAMHEDLKISSIDPLLEKIELEINRLYLGEKE